MDSTSILIAALCIWLSWGAWAAYSCYLQISHPLGRWYSMYQGHLSFGDKVALLYFFIMPPAIFLYRIWDDNSFSWKDYNYRRRNK